MLNNITNFFNLIKTGKVKTQLDGTDLLPIGTKDFRFTGQYQPTMIKYSDLVSGLVGGSNGQVLFNDNDTIAGASNLYYDKLTGRVGIGTNTPAYLLNVNGTARITSLIPSELISPSPTEIIFVKNSSGVTAGRILPDGNILRISSSGAHTTINIFSTGNLGINQTTDAGFRLDVNGTARVQSGLIVQGLTIGRGGGNANSVAIGLEAAPLTTATQNCAVGYRALFNNTGGDNTAVGAFYAMFANTTGTRNTGIGAYALNGNTTGQYNTAIGYNTSSGNFSNSTILGYGAAATADNQFVVGSSGVNAGLVDTSGISISDFWNIKVNGTDYKVAMGSSSVASARLQVDSTTQGFLPPRMTQTQRNAIASPAIGLEIYQTDATEGKYIYKSSGWTYIG
jgi:hypothetical protein